MRGPLLSVCMISYQHADFIRQAIESVFAQSTDFPIELVIFDDASTDETARIIRSLHPPAHITMKATLRTSNVGMLQNLADALSACTGKYIALLEGDDYWTDPEKLQIQVDFLEGHPEFSACCHPCRVECDQPLPHANHTFAQRDTATIHELAERNFIYTGSVVFRAGLYGALPEQFFRATAGDYWLHMLNAQFGLIKSLPREMAVYRIHEGGVWSMKPDVDLRTLSLLEGMIDYFEPSVAQILKQQYTGVAVHSFLLRLGQADGFDERLQRACRYGSEALRKALSRRLSGSSSDGAHAPPGRRVRWLSPIERALRTLLARRWTRPC